MTYLMWFSIVTASACSGTASRYWRTRSTSGPSGMGSCASARWFRRARVVPATARSKQPFQYAARENACARASGRALARGLYFRNVGSAISPTT